jgi:Tol biopolymer transport system component
MGWTDGPEYSPDGEFIYFNSDRTGTMQIWRMHRDGSAQEQVTSDDYNNWFPHPSPDGRWIVFPPATRTSKATRKTRTSCCA